MYVKNSESVSSSSISFKWILLCDEQDCILRIRSIVLIFADVTRQIQRWIHRNESKSSLQKSLNATSVAHVWRQLFSLTKSIDDAAVMHCRLLWKIYFEFRSLYELFLSTSTGHYAVPAPARWCPRELPRQVFSPHTQPFRKFDLPQCARRGEIPPRFEPLDRGKEKQTSESASRQWRNVKLNWLATHKTARVVWLTLQRWRLRI